MPAIPTTLLSPPPRSAIDVRAAGSRHERDLFVRLPWSIYHDDPAWVPPLLLERKDFIDPRKHPFYRHGAAIQFLAWRGQQVVGRIMVSDDPRYNEVHDSSVGCFGLFESTDDDRVAHALLDAAAAWLRARGRTEMMGPIDYSTNYACGLLVDGFATQPRVMMNHNPVYYARLLESYGLTKARDLYAWWFDDPHDICNKWQRRVERSERHGIVIRQFRKRELPSEIMRCRHVYNLAWRKHWASVPMTDAEFRYYAKFLAEMAPPEMLLVAEADGQPVGFSLTLPDLNEAIRPLEGRLTRWGLPLGYLRFRRNLPKIRTARLLAMGILEEYRRRGIAEMLILHTLRNGKQSQGYTAAELSWTLDENVLINRTIAAVGGKRYKTYRIYEKSIAGA